MIAGVKKYKCTLCDDQYISAHSLRQHLESIHEKKKYTCDICSKSYSHKGTLKMHMNSHSTHKVFTCTLCSKTFLTKQNLKYHSAVHQALKSFKCHSCSSAFITNGKLTEHIKQVHEKNIQYKCSMCPKSFPHKWSLMLHTRRHVGAQKCRCPHCPFLADGKKDLNKHLKVHFADGKYKCTECSASYNSRLHQRHHLRMIHKKDPGYLEPLVYKCSKCPREYKHHASWQRHELTHDQIRNFKCDKCVARFYTKIEMVNHMAVHQNGTGEFVCTICNADFYKRELFSNHSRKWHGLDTTHKSQKFNFKCLYCVAQFKEKWQTIKHEKVHETTSDKYFCQPCNAKFFPRLSLSIHNSMWHSKNVSSAQTEQTNIYEYSELQKDTMLTHRDQTDLRSFFANTFIE